MKKGYWVYRNRGIVVFKNINDCTKAILLCDYINEMKPTLCAYVVNIITGEIIYSPNKI